MVIKPEHSRIYGKFKEINDRLDRQEKLYLKINLFLKDLSHKLDIHKKTVGLHKEDA